MPGRSTTILAMLLNCWRRVHEDNQQKESNQSTFPSCRTRTPESRQGRAQDRPDVRHADLRVGKRQGRGKETVNLSYDQRTKPPLIISGIGVALPSPHRPHFRQHLRLLQHYFRRLFLLVRWIAVLPENPFHNS